MPQDWTKDAAGLLWQAWTTGTRMDELPVAVRPRTVGEGMSVQRALTERAGPHFGWKVAATSAASQATLGVDAPLAGAMYEQFRLTDGATISLAGQRMRVAEPEFAFRMGTDVASRTPAMPDVLSAVAAVHLAIEVPDSRYASFDGVDGPQIAADGACTGTFVLGPEVAGWDELDFPNQPVELIANDSTFSEGSGAEVLDDPRVALLWLATALAEYGEQLRAGDIVTTGSAARPAPVSPGDVVTAEFPGLGNVTARFAD